MLRLRLGSGLHVCIELMCNFCEGERERVRSSEEAEVGLRLAECGKTRGSNY